MAPCMSAKAKFKFQVAWNTKTSLQSTKIRYQCYDEAFKVEIDWPAAHLSHRKDNSWTMGEKKAALADADKSRKKPKGNKEKQSINRSTFNIGSWMNITYQLEQKVVQSYAFIIIMKKGTDEKKYI